MVRSIAGMLAILSLISTVELQANQRIWQDAGVSARGAEVGRLFTADNNALREQLVQVPNENLSDLSHSIQLPMPDGRLAKFTIIESPIMEPGLALKYPDIKTFKVYGIDDPMASGRVDITPQGFHAMLFTSAGRLFIDPNGMRDQRMAYRAHYRHGYPTQRFSCGVHPINFDDPVPMEPALRTAARIPGSLLQYRLAVAATREYVNAVTGGFTDIAAAQAEIVTAINRVNQIYERDLGIQLILVANNDLLIENGGNVSFSNNNATLMLDQNQTWLDSGVLTSANYDIGHVFSTGGGGLAQIASVCELNFKAQGVTGLSNPTGDSFYIDYVAHEIGHQFGANHSFNGTTSSCAGLNRNPATAFEPGSGSTIMGYAGICGVENLQIGSDATFHAGSIDEINAYTTTGAGNSCASPMIIAPANADPTFDPIPSLLDRNIPINTPFTLDASASDPNSDTVSYQWDQMDAGTATNAVTFGDDLTTNSLFRSFEPKTDGRRDFPALGTQLLGLFDDAEVLPQQARSINMRVTARDNRSGQATEDVTLSVIGSAGPFRVTSQAIDTTIVGSNGNYSVSWDVANTNSGAVSCANVSVELLAFNNASYTTHSVHALIASTPNNGSVSIPPPTLWLTAPKRGRFKVRCIDNYFYALSQGDVFFEGTGPAANEFDVSGASTMANNGGTVGATPPGGLSSSDLPSLGGGGGGGGSFNLSWLLWLSFLLPWHRGRRVRSDSEV